MFGTNVGAFIRRFLRMAAMFYKPASPFLVATLRVSTAANDTAS
jgi:hypothetical protein